MNRRRFLQNAGLGVFGITVGGAWWLQRSAARLHLRRQMMSQIDPLLAEHRKKLAGVPQRGKEEFLQFVHGKCLNAHRFVAEVCSFSYREKLAQCCTDEARNQLLLTTFLGQVVAPAEVLAETKRLATALGTEIDESSRKTCLAVSGTWQTPVGRASDADMPNNLHDRIQALTTMHVQAALRHAMPEKDRPALAETVRSIGSSAILLLHAPIQPYPALSSDIVNA